MSKLTSIAKNVGHGISKNSPTILTVMACGGVISTVIFAAKAGMKSHNDILMRPVESEELTKKETIKLVWKNYIPTALSGLLTMGCIIGSNKISGDRTAAFASIAAASASTLQEYQSKVVEKIGEKKNQQIRDEISTEHAKRDVGKSEIIITGNGDYLCYDVMSGRYFRSDINKIKRVENDAREELMREMWITLNDVYYMLGLTGTKLGDYVGWDPDNQPYFSFTSMLSENSEPCLCIDYSVRPKAQEAFL